ncbi:MAG: hypothetical protein WCB57_00050, partial [Pseudonocardiaceae bacterium]
ADPTTRVAAIAGGRRDALPRPDVMHALIAVLADATDDPRVRRAAQGALEELSFAEAEFAPYATAYRDALRAAANDPDPGLADGALEVLTLNRDDYAQRLLIEGLEQPATARVDRVRALQMLGYDLHAGHLPLVRRIAKDATDPAERVTALRLLAGDAESADLLERTVADRSQDLAARTTSAAALNALNPARFAETARRIVLDPDDDDELRAVCLTALTVASEPPDQDLAAAVMSNPTPPSPELEKAANSYRGARQR